MSTKSAPADGDGSVNVDGGSERPPIPRRIWNWLFQPVVRLPNDFPLTGARLGKHYAVAVTIFFAGSFLPGLLLIGWLWALLKFTTPKVFLPWFQMVLDFSGKQPAFRPTALTLLLLTSFICGFVPQLWYISRVMRKYGRKMSDALGLRLEPLGTRLRWRKIWALTWQTVVGSALIMGLSWGLGKVLHPPKQPTVEYMEQAFGGNLLIWFVMAAILAPLFEEVIFRGFLFQALRATFLRWQNPDAPEPPPFVSEPQPKVSTQHRPQTKARRVVRFAGKVLWWLTMPVWGPLWVVYVIARAVVVVAAVFVCLVFVALWELLRPFARLAWWLARPLALPCYRALQWLGHAIPRWVGKYVINTPAKADLAAVLVSSAVFGMQHLQSPTTTVLLFAMGCFLAETFRRTGSLWTGIFIHAVNNGISVILVAMFR